MRDDNDFFSFSTSLLFFQIKIPLSFIDASVPLTHSMDCFDFNLCLLARLGIKNEEAKKKSTAMCQKNTTKKVTKWMDAIRWMMLGKEEREWMIQKRRDAELYRGIDAIWMQ